jgi:D-alanyl-D-alanine carboxypeptidase
MQLARRFCGGGKLFVGALILFFSLVLGGCGSATTPPPKDEVSYHRLLEWTRENGVPGSVLLVQTPRGKFLEATGCADKTARTPMTPDYEFRIGSISKMFVGIVAAELIAEGKLDVNAPITDLLPPSITDHITNAKQITLMELLRHMSGIYDYEQSIPWQIRRMLLDTHGQYSTLEALSYAYDKPAQFAPNQGWAYSNTNYVLVGLIIDRAVGHHHSIEVRKRILEPLGMTHTFYDGYETPVGEGAHGYEQLPWTRDTTDWSPPIAGPGGMVSTAEDTAKFVRAVVRDDGFLSPATRKALRGIPWPGPDAAPSYWPTTGYYCGISTAQLKEANSVNFVFFGHDGAYPGYFSLAYHEPQRDITIVYLGNSALFGRDHRLGPDNFFFDRLNKELIRLSLQQTEDHLK